MNKEFTKDMLKLGDLLTFRNGEKLCLDKCIDITNYNDYLTHKQHNKWDIVKVERIQVDWKCADGKFLTKHIGEMKKKYFNEHLSYQVIWEREEEMEDYEMNDLAILELLDNVNKLSTRNKDDKHKLFYQVKTKLNDRTELQKRNKQLETKLQQIREYCKRETSGEIAEANRYRVSKDILSILEEE